MTKQCKEPAGTQEHDGRCPTDIQGPNRLRRAREQAGLSLGQAAKLLGWSQGPLDSMERGVGHPPSEADLRRLSEIYGCSVQWLRGDHVEPPAHLVKMFRDSNVSPHDRDILLEFAASIQGRPPSGTARERLATVAAQNARGCAECPVEQCSRCGQPESPTCCSEVPTAEKARYVHTQQQTRDHHCHWPGCNKQVPPAMWGCRPHWYRLPKSLRDRIWRAYAPGQEVDMSPSAEYMRVADDVQRWIREHA